MPLEADRQLEGTRYRKFFTSLSVPELHARVLGCSALLGVRVSGMPVVVRGILGHPTYPHTEFTAYFLKAQVKPEDL